MTRLDCDRAQTYSNVVDKFSELDNLRKSSKVQQTDNVDLYSYTRDVNIKDDIDTWNTSSI
jgi:hypothetical protein